MQLTDDIWQRVRESRIIAVLVVDSADEALSACEALLAGGIDAIELAMRTPAAAEAMRAVHDRLPQMLLGAGTVLTPAQVHQCKAAGCDFAVAPGCSRRVVAEAVKAQLPFAPGIATPSDIEAALEFDCRILKFYPAELMGGLDSLTSMVGPYQHLGLRFIPLGGVNEQNYAAYLANPLIWAVGGSWLAPRKLIQQRDWAEITRRAGEAMQMADASMEKVASFSQS